MRAEEMSAQLKGNPVLIVTFSNGKSHRLSSSPKLMVMLIFTSPADPEAVKMKKTFSPCSVNCVPSRKPDESATCANPWILLPKMIGDFAKGK